MALWDDPYYPFPTENKVRGGPIIIDVTSSAQNFEAEIAGLADLTGDFTGRNPAAICDFGAGRLRNTLFLLRKGFAVWAVEHQQTFERPQAKARLAIAKRHRRFKLISPKAFPDTNEAYDAVLLINVVNTIPDAQDRAKVIHACAAHLRRGGLLVWMTQYGEPHYRRGAATRMRIADGYCYNLGHEYQTFVNEFSIPDIRGLVPAAQFRELRQLNVRYHHAFVFERR